MNLLNARIMPNYPILVVVVCLLPFLGLADFHTRGEAREALVVKSIINEGNIVLPRGYSGAVPSKPPAFHWVSAVASGAFGDLNEFTLRIPSAVFSLICIALFFFTAKAVSTLAVAQLMVLFLAFSFEWLRSSVISRVDMVHSASLACALLLAFKYLELSGGKLSLWMSIVFLCIATLAKGPVAIVLSTLIFILWGVFRRKDPSLRVRLLRIGAGITLAALLALIWYLLAYFKAPAEFLNKFWSENISRFAGTMDESPHQHSVLYLLGVFLLASLPWSPLILWVWAKNCPRNLLQLKEKLNGLSILEKYAALCALTIFLFYSIPESKRSVYLLAAYPFLAFLASAAAVRAFGPQEKLVKRAFIFGAVIVVIFQAIIVPYFVAPRTSELKLAKLIAGDSYKTKKIYSFDFEYYGASFYSGVPFYRLEEALGHQGISPLELPKPSEAVIVYDRDSADTLSAALALAGLTAVPEHDIEIGRKEVIISGVKQIEAQGQEAPKF